MPTRRMIHSEIWQSESIGMLTRDQRLLFIGLFSSADDQGRLSAHPALLRSLIFPYDDIGLDQISADLQALIVGDFITQYENEGRKLLQVNNWWTYQKPQWAYPSKYPPPEGWLDRLRYREGGDILTENWCTPKGKSSGDSLPNDLPNDLPNPDSLLPSDSVSVSDSLSVRGSDSIAGAAAPEQKALPQQGVALALELYGTDAFSCDELEALEECEQRVGTDKTTEALRWAHDKNIRKMRTICTTAEGWVVHKGNGSRGSTGPPSEPSLMEQAKALREKERTKNGRQGRHNKTADGSNGGVARF